MALAAQLFDLLWKMVLQERIELSTSPLPRECSTTELLQRRMLAEPCGSLAWRLNRRLRGRVQEQFGGFLRSFAGRLAWPVLEGLMREKSDDIAAAKPKSQRESEREARLKLALKANMGRRKAQARARSAADSDAEASEDNNKNE